MKSTLYKLNKTSSLTTRLTLTAMLMTLTSASFADGSSLAYVDSVHKWGAWGLDIEPAAGGLSQPTTQALNARSTKVTLRTNSNSALAPKGPPTVVGLNTTPNAPPLPTLPAPAPPLPAPVSPTAFAPPVATSGPSYSPPPSTGSSTIKPVATAPTGNGSLF